MAMDAQTIEDMIRAGIPGADVRIEDLRGDGEHYAAYVSAAATRDPVTNTNHYLADLKIDPAEFEKLAGLPLKPGMPVEVFVATQDRTAISSLSKPFMDQFAKAFREE